VTGGESTARRVVGLLGGIFTYAVKDRKLRADNPCRGVERGTDKQRNRVLSPHEYAALGKALDTLVVGGANPVAVYAAQVIAKSQTS
jgi:hypothetical protein